VKPAPFDYLRPGSLAEAIAALAGEPDAKVLAGGQSLVPLLSMRLAAPSLLVDLNGLPGLAEVTVSSDEAARWLDGGHSVDGVAIPPAVFAWVGEYVENNYRPQPQKRIKPRSFQHPKDRV